MLLVIEGRASIGRRKEVRWRANSQQNKRSCDVAKMTITKDVRSNLAELLGVRRPATVSRIDRECIERVD